MIPPLHPNRAIIYSLSPTRKVGFLSSKTTSIRAPEFHHFGRTKPALVNCFCSYNNEAGQDQDPPREAVLKAISEVSKTQGRMIPTNEWLALDKKVNSYPTVRGFTAIGTGGDDFVQAMVIAVESVTQQTIPEGQVRQKVSSRGKYVSVNIGPVQVVSSEQEREGEEGLELLRSNFKILNFLLAFLVCRKAVGIMLTNAEQLVVNVDSEDLRGRKLEDSPTASVSNSPTQNSRPSSMVVKKANTLIPAHLVAEAISTIRGLDLRWSGPITHSEMQYVRQYVFAKYPQYCNGIVVDGDSTFDLTNLCIDEESSKTTPYSKRGLPQSFGARESTPKFTRSLSDLGKTQLEVSRLVDILNKKASFQGNFISIPEIQMQNRALKHCGLSEADYLVIFMPNYRDAMVIIGESYPFFRGNYYMTVIEEEKDMIREFAAGKESKVIPMPETWLDLRIKGSHLSQYFRRKCKQIPKGLFSYPATVNETRYSLHWISEARRNSWHVLLDATGFVFGEHRLPLALHLPDFVLCTLDNTHAQPSKITCLLVRKSSFDTSASLG
ncbi:MOLYBDOPTERIN COFACTOR SULFURASE MOSC [Salix purpurea]|uniref:MOLYBDOPTERIN COFACTOR SULFURASE MOSC n=1 Tax=Salix purpurea TaxID=77065 RepID=A0A9Q0QEC6_SALPP|nr:MOLYBDOPTERIN COFACTOR SULFURASE MOSC [Salix purpurea]